MSGMVSSLCRANFGISVSNLQRAQQGKGSFLVMLCVASLPLPSIQRHTFETSNAFSLCLGG